MAQEATRRNILLGQKVIAVVFRELEIPLLVKLEN